MLLTLLFWALALATLALACITARRILKPAATPVQPLGRTAIIAPCKGVDPEFPRFLRALSRQDLADYRVYFVIADEHDLAAPLIRELLANHPDLGELVVFPPPYGYTGKIANMIGGVEAAWRDKAEFLIFLDSDTVPDPKFSAYLVAPLVRGEAMLTTGARILVPGENNIPQWIASLWTSTSLPGVTQPQQGSAWGGAMAIRAGDAIRLDVKSIWKGAFSDDHTLSRAVRSDGGIIQFVSHCLIVVPIDYAWADLLDFLVRQLVTIRVHDIRLWYVAWSMIFPVLLVIVAIAQWAVWADSWGIWTLAALVPVASAYYVVNEAVWRRLRLESIHLRMQPVIRQVAMLALLAIMHPLAMICSTFIRRFTWRGRRYEIREGKIVMVEHAQT